MDVYYEEEEIQSTVDCMNPTTGEAQSLAPGRLSHTLTFRAAALPESQRFLQLCPASPSQTIAFVTQASRMKVPASLLGRRQS